MQRYRCSTCGKTFSALTGTPLARLGRHGCADGPGRTDSVRLSSQGQATLLQALADLSAWRHAALGAAAAKRRKPA